MTAYDFRRLDEYLDYLTGWNIPGNDLKIIKDGKEIYRHTSGYRDIANRIPFDGTEVMNMWSCSKVVTSVALLTLLEKGKFSLKDYLGDYIPEYSNVKVRIRDESGNRVLVPAKNRIRILDLFSMRSGLSYDIDSGIIDRVRKSTGGDCNTGEFIKALAENPFEFEPGSGYAYGMSIDVLAYLAEVLTGRSFNEYVKETIFDPLDMRNSTFSFENEELLSKRCVQYSYDYDKKVPVATNNSVGFVFGKKYESGGAGLVSTVDDLSKVAYMLANRGTGINGAKILSGAAVDLMKENVLSPEQIKMFHGLFPYQQGYGYGLGVRTMIDRAAGGSLGPVGEFGWAGAAGTWIMCDTENRLCAVYGEVMLGSFEEIIHSKLRDIIYACIS